MASLSSLTLSNFDYRQNQDGEVELYCLLCNRVIASALTSRALVPVEDVHDCQLVKRNTHPGTVSGRTEI